ncbi:MAG: diguanylate cyclase [Candidatus Accumulibacter sp.]|jgi:diguanylate cyclase (GGDEF)-like protein|nr:diguanylate cyclase [Accumulibacter sp.]
MGKLDEFLGNIPIKRKVTSIAVFTGLLVLVLSVVTTIVGLNNNIRHQKSMGNFSRQFGLMRDISGNYNKIHGLATEYLLFWGDRSITDRLTKEFDASFEILEKDVVELEGMLPPLSPQSEAINKAYGYLYHLHNFRFTLPSLAPDEVSDFFIKLQNEIIKPLDNNMNVAFNAFVHNINDESESNQEQYNISVRTSYAIIVVLFILGIIYVSIVIRNIVIPLGQLTHATEHFGRGHFSELSVVVRKDELGILNNKFVSAAQEIKNAQTALEESNKHLHELNKKLESLSMTDPITGISNRRALDEYVAHAWEECKRSQRPLTIMYMDIDRFKYYNDTFGHLQGDECLRSFVRCVSGLIRRAVDMFARCGGEEFVAVFPAVTGESALALAEKIRRAVEDMKISNPMSEAGPYVTVSIGLATRYTYQIKNVWELMELADKMSYESKTSGRNRITANTEPPFDYEAAMLAAQSERAVDGEES